MTNKITKESLKEMIRSVLEQRLKEEVPVEDEELGPGGAGLPGDDEEETADSGYESTLSPEDAETGWEAGGNSPFPLDGLDAQELVQVMRDALNLLDKDESLEGSSEAVAAHQDEELEEQSKTDRPDRVAGRDSGGRRLDEDEECPVCEKEKCECAPVEEATTHQDVLDAADDAVDATNKAAAKEKSKKASAQKPAKDSDAKYDDDLFDDSQDDEIAGIKETDLNGTPERENNLYEARFSKRNANLFEDLVKKWTK